MSNKMWGGRFSERPDAIMEEINVSIDVDRHLYAQDIAASKAHAAMLAAQGIITQRNIHEKNTDSRNTRRSCRVYLECDCAYVSVHRPFGPEHDE